MAKQNQAPEAASVADKERLKFRVVDVKNQPLARPVSSGFAVVKTNGHGTVNKSGAKSYLERVVKPTGMLPAETLCKFGVNADGFVALYCVPPGTPGAVSLKMTKKGQMIVRMHELFDEEPDIRPPVNRKCVAYIDEDADGVMCMVINVQAGQEVTKGGSKSKAAAGK